MFRLIITAAYVFAIHKKPSIIHVKYFRINILYDIICPHAAKQQFVLQYVYGIIVHSVFC